MKPIDEKTKVENRKRLGNWWKISDTTVGCHPDAKIAVREFLANERGMSYYKIFIDKLPVDKKTDIEIREQVDKWTAPAFANSGPRTGEAAVFEFLANKKEMSYYPFLHDKEELKQINRMSYWLRRKICKGLKCQNLR